LVGHLQLVPHGPAEVGEEQHGAAPPDLAAEGQHPALGQAHGDGRLADLALDRSASRKKPLALHLAKDDGNRLRRKVCQPRQVTAGHGAMALQKGQQQTLIVVANPTLVHATADGPDDLLSHGGHHKDTFWEAIGGPDE
jgi:hypothetical protein